MRDINDGYSGDFMHEWNVFWNLKIDTLIKKFNFSTDRPPQPQAFQGN